MATLNVFTESSVPGLPCNWTVDTGCCPEWDTYSPELQVAAAEFAAVSIWAATGRKYGACRRTVRPCHRDCGDCDQWRAGYFWADGVWFPYVLNGLWRNCWCGAPGGCCTCRAQCQVWLQPPVSGIVEVRFASSGVVDPATYRVDNWQWLVRQGPAVTGSGATDCWPTCNDYNFPVQGSMAPTDDSAWEVTYLWGLPVPGVLQRAAGTYACEYAKSCLGQPCALPQRVTSISRQGVSVTLADVDQLLQNGLTGIVTVDSIIQRFNPYRLSSRMKIASPDITPIREQTWP